MLEAKKIVTYNVAIYIRLSKEDIDKGFNESESVQNQKLLLTNHVKKLGWNYKIIDTYIDDGYTGTNFDRPNFKRMIEDIELGKINMVITKDLSRLGRDYIETGKYIESWFPQHYVRYISVTDGIDTFAINNGNNDIAPFKSILNDMYSKDLSKKIKTSLNTMQKQGKWACSSVPLGYKRDPNDKNHLIICEEEAKIVKIIFEMALAGKKLCDIKNYLINNNIPTYRKIRYNKSTFWENKAIKNILQNPIYIGTSIQNKTSRISYKNRKLKTNPTEEWYIVENTHEPIINQRDFKKVQNLIITQKYSRNEKKHKFLLDGLLICYECKHKIGVRTKRNGNLLMVCNNYRRNSKLGLCTSHGFNYEKLEKAILSYIKKLFLNINDEKIELIVKKSKTIYDYKKMLENIEKEIKELEENMDKMYIDKLNGKITEEMYDRIYDNFKKNIEQKNKEATELQNKKELSEQDDTENIKEIVKEFLKLENPSPEIMRILINRIEIHQDKQVDIVFNFKQLNILENRKCLF